MSIADKILAFANEKENIRFKLGIPKDIPFSEYSKYLQWQGGMTIPNKSFYADFTNNRYVKDGVPCNFKDLFTFNRAGKAWLVKDTGLQEYEVDVPRLDNGLLIEQESTNICLNSTDFTKWTISDTFNKDYSLQNTVKLTEDTAVNSTRNLYMNTIDGQDVRVSFIVQSQGIKSVMIGTEWHGDGSNAPVYDLINNKVLGSLFSGDSNYSIKSLGGLGSVVTRKALWALPYHRPRMYAIKGNEDKNYRHTNSPYDGDGVSAMLVSYPQYLTEDAVPNSVIPTTTSPVTRPADFLLNNISGTTVTGDWDSTLTLSIVNGNLVHSGYGRIRSLEIN